MNKTKHITQDGWQPIETAPKDGTPVLLWGLWAGEISGISGAPGMEVGSYSGSGDYASEGFLWAATGGDAYGVWCKPTHWHALPLPPPPTQEGGGMNENGTGVLSTFNNQQEGA